MTIRDSVRYREEVAAVTRHYAGISAPLALRFLDALDLARQRAARNPRVFRDRGGGIRAALLGRFPYRLRFELRPGDREIWFLSITHVARRDDDPHAAG